MIIDSSALLAILQGEPEGPRFTDLLLAADTALISAPNWLEASMVMLSRRGEAGLADLNQFRTMARIEIVPFDGDHASIALEAFQRFGKGRHSAALNLGDCCAYALARATGQPLLFKGHDFPQTDVASAA